MIYLLENIYSSPSKPKMFKLNAYPSLQKFSIKILLAACKNINNSGPFGNNIKLLVFNINPIVGIEI